MPADALDPLPLLRALAERAVDHIVIGGFAVNAHGYVRPSKDLDIVPRSSRDNLARLAGLLRELNARNADSSDFDSAEFPFDPTKTSELEHGGNFRLSTDIGELDVMQWVAGIETDDLFAELDREAIEAIVDDVAIRVCGLRHLIAMKRAAGRPRDLDDVERLDA